MPSALHFISGSLKESEGCVRRYEPGQGREILRWPGFVFLDVVCLRGAFSLRADDFLCELDGLDAVAGVGVGTGAVGVVLRDGGAADHTGVGAGGGSDDGASS